MMQASKWDGQKWRQRPRLLEPGDLEAIIDYCKLTGQSGERARARIAEHRARWKDDTQRDADFAREEGDWCGND
jgi:hypothetical protein